MAKAPKSAFDVDLAPEQETAIAHRLCDAIQDAKDARQSIIGEGGDLDYWYWYYEQGQSAKGSRPWPGAADLTSYMITESVDAQRARMVKTVFVEPVYIVEGWGESAKQAPIVEEFHQWQVEQERLQSKLGKVFHVALIEGTGILEVTERAEKRKVRTTRDVALEQDEDGAPILDEDNKPKLKRDPDTGDFINATGAGSARVVVSETKTIRKGPQYRVLSLRDFLFLPGHAKDDSEVWGYAKRFHRRIMELKGLEESGVYRNVDQLSATPDREAEAFITRDGQQIAPQEGDAIEKELWEVLVLMDLDEDGLEEWYVVTVSVPHKVLLRCQHDDLGQPRYLAFTPFPRADSMYGYSLAGHKILTLAEEHTALRNMIADRSMLATNPPLTRVHGALWEPSEVRFGTGAVMDVRDHNEVKAMQIPDVPQSAIERERNVLQAKERVSGQNDIAVGTTPETGRTLGEIQIRTEQSFVRMDESIRYVQETMEDLGQLRHTLYVRMLENEATGIEPPESIVRNLEMRGAQIEGGKFTVEMLKGTFRFKPRGSVDTADLAKEAQAYTQWMDTMGKLGQFFPGLQQVFSRPQAVRAMVENGLRVNRVRDRQAFLPPPGPEGDALLQPPQPAPLAPSGQPGDPNGLPPEIAQMLQQGGAVQ